MKNNLILFNYHIIYLKMTNNEADLMRAILTALLAGISYYMLRIILSLEKRLDEINKELKENIENEKRTSSKLNAFLDNYTIMDYDFDGESYSKRRARLNKLATINYTDMNNIEISYLRLLRATNTPIKFRCGTTNYDDIKTYLNEKPHNMWLIKFNYTGELINDNNITQMLTSPKKVADIPRITLMDDYGEEYIVPIYVLARIFNTKILSSDNRDVTNLYKKSFDTFVNKHGGYEFGKLTNACDIDEVKLLFI